MSELVGKHLGEFEVVRELGRGGMGVVFEAVQTSLNRRVALKVLGPGLGLTAKAVQRFRREAEAAAKLHHTNIVPVYATGEEGGVHFYAMELIDGPSLDRVVADLREAKGAKTAPALAPELTTTGPYLDTSTPTGFAVASGLSSGGAYFDTVARVIADVADALAHAHANGVIHRDIKPGNLLLGTDGRLSVNDFGLARALEEPGMTTTGEFVGTPAYMAPEQIAGGRIPVDHRCDIYSLGATLYELLTLRPPFVADRRDQLLAMVVQKEPAVPRGVNPQVPRDLETICLKCLEKDPDRRYRTAQALADDLRRFLNRFAIQARRAGAVGRMKKWVKRHPALSGAMLVAVLAAGAAGFFAWQAHRSDVARRAADEEHERERREQRRQAATEKAILAAMTGDFVAAEAAIDEALANGASPGESRLLRGCVAHHRGGTKAAIDHLNAAVIQMPHSVAASAYRGYLFFNYDNQIEAEREMARLAELTPVTPLDFILKGGVEGIFDPLLGLKSLDRAVEMANLPLARLVRAELRGYRALDTGAPADARAAVEEAAVAKVLLPGNPLPLVASLTANRCAARVFTGEDAKRAKEQAEQDAIALARFPVSAATTLPCAWYFDSVGQTDAALALAKSVSDSQKADGGDAPYLALLGLRGDLKTPAEVIERQMKRGPAPDPVALFNRGWVLAETGPEGRARALEQYRTSKLLQHQGTESLYPQLVLRLLGRPNEAVAVCRKLRAGSGRWLTWRDGWYQRVLEYNCGDISAEKLLEIAGPSRYNRCEAQFFIGMVKLAEGDKAGARKAFEESVATDVFFFREFVGAASFARMTADPNWPPWIEKTAPAKP